MDTNTELVTCKWAFQSQKICVTPFIFTSLQSDRHFLENQRSNNNETVCKRTVLTAW